MTVEKAREAFIEKMKTYSFINKKGVQCRFRCPNFIPDYRRHLVTWHLAASHTLHVCFFKFLN